jgi:putative DNA modification/repair radical SAM protein
MREAAAHFSPDPFIPAFTLFCSERLSYPAKNAFLCTVMNETVLNKLKVLAESAKYDVSCASSGTVRRNQPGGLGNTVGGMGICHSFTEDGRCVSLLKIMLTNCCIFDCAYCINRRTNDIPRATFAVSELVELTVAFYRRNYIEGLFLSSGVVRSADYTMERMVRAVKDLRTAHRFNGYIHLKSIPGCSQELVAEGGRYADRMSVNLEIPSEANLRLLAPEKSYGTVFAPMRYIQQGMLQSLEERRTFRHAPRFVPAGQSTQMIIGATPENDCDILRVSSALYRRPSMKRVYYSGYIPVNADARLPALQQAPLVRENRLYQADWLMRFYQFGVDEIVDEQYPNLDLDIDPKLAWALRHPEQFPVDVNRADYSLILRVPGVGVKSAKLIVASRRFGQLTAEQLKKIGVVMKKAQYFITCRELPVHTVNEVTPEHVRRLLTAPRKRRTAEDRQQLPILFPD